MIYECPHFRRDEKPMFPNDFGDDCPNCSKMATKRCPVRKKRRGKPKRDAKGRYVRSCDA